MPIKGSCPDFPVLFIHDSPHRHRCKIVLFGKGFQIVTVVFLHDALIAGDPLKAVALRYVDRLGSVYVDQLQIVFKADKVGHLPLGGGKIVGVDFPLIHRHHPGSSARS